MMIAATLIDGVIASAVTADGRHMALTLRDCEGNLMTLGFPGEAVPRLIDHAASALTERAQILRGDGEPTERFEVNWWNLARENRSGGYVLSLTFGAGGSLDFVLTRHMAASLLDTLRGHLDAEIGFG